MLLGPLNAQENVVGTTKSSLCELAFEFTVEDAPYIHMPHV